MDDIIYSNIMEESNEADNVLNNAAGNASCIPGGNRGIGCTARLVERNFKVDF